MANGFAHSIFYIFGAMVNCMKYSTIWGMAIRYITILGIGWCSFCFWAIDSWRLFEVCIAVGTLLSANFCNLAVNDDMVLHLVCTDNYYCEYCGYSAIGTIFDAMHFNDFVYLLITKYMK